MGRLTLNVLLSFVQLEREVIGERIRDKLPASRARGMWMGGKVTLGYDVMDHQLIQNEAEAARVRRLFDLYVEPQLGTATGNSRRKALPADPVGCSTRVTVTSC